MNVGKLLKQIALIAAPVVTTAVAGPAAGAAVGAALGSGAVGKVAGKKIEAKTGVRAQKVLAPAAAVTVPAVGMALVDPGLLDQICDFLAKVCESKAALLALPGLATILWHTLVSNVHKAADKTAT